MTRNRSGGEGQKAVIPWEALYPPTQTPPLYRYQATTSVSMALPSGRDNSGKTAKPTVDAKFQRVKANVQRDGHGLYATRPGRDTAMPPLGPSLGTGPGLRGGR